MPFNVWYLSASAINVTNVGLGSEDQGDGSHLVGEYITLNSSVLTKVVLRDNDSTFDDNDNNQVLDGAQTIEGQLLPDGRRVEAEYRITLRDPDTGIEYTALGFNANNSSPSYETIEGLVFVDDFPPTGVALEVIEAFEGPGNLDPETYDYETDLVPCFVAGTTILTPDGAVPVETLTAGDLVSTRDNGPQRIRWVGHTDVDAGRLQRCPGLRPVQIARNAFGDGMPDRDTLISQQHRILVQEWRAEMLFGETELLVPAKHLCNDQTVLVDQSLATVCYVHILFDTHEIILANGLETESFLPGAQILSGMNPAMRAELLELFPELATGTGATPNPVRPLLRAWESAVLTG